MSERTIEQRLTAIEVALQLVLSPEHRVLINSSDVKESIKEVAREIRCDEETAKADMSRVYAQAMQARQEVAMRRVEHDFAIRAQEAKIKY